MAAQFIQFDDDLLEHITEAVEGHRPQLSLPYIRGFISYIYKVEEATLKSLQESICFCCIISNFIRRYHIPVTLSKVQEIIGFYRYSFDFL